MNVVCAGGFAGAHLCRLYVRKIDKNIYPCHMFLLGIGNFIFQSLYLCGFSHSHCRLKIWEFLKNSHFFKIILDIIFIGYYNSRC